MYFIEISVFSLYWKARLSKQTETSVGRQFPQQLGMVLSREIYSH